MHRRTITPDTQVVPQSIVDYLSHISSVITEDGKETVFNLPQIAIAQGPIMVYNLKAAESGSFAAVNAANHNVYEALISPLVTSEY